MTAHKNFDKLQIKSEYIKTIFIDNYLNLLYIIYLSQLIKLFSYSFQQQTKVLSDKPGLLLISLRLIKSVARPLLMSTAAAFVF